MAPYHVVLVHFPIAFLMTATLAILLRCFSEGTLARAVDRALVPLMTLGLLAGVTAYLVGLNVWPWEAISATPLGRNHMLMASWTLAVWCLVLVTRWSRGEAVWHGASRWVMAFLAILGSTLLGITGTLGGHLIGVYTELAAALNYLGWNVHTTFYMPDTTLMIIVAAAVLLALIGLLGGKRQA